jgi:hypothetical protein
MKYICIEAGEVTSLMSYEPEVPSGVTVVEITDEKADQLEAGTHIFDVPTQSVTLKTEQVTRRENTIESNGQEREFLNSTDWKVLRHIRQKHLGIATTLTEEQYTELENQREAAAQRVVDIE